MRLIFILFFSYSLLSAQDVKLSGLSKSYANDTLIFYKFDDLISKKEIEIGRTVVNDSGYFECTIPVNTTILSHIYLSIYKGLLFLEPGSSYNIKLPEKTKKDQTELLNPFYKEIELYLGVYDAHKNDLNFLIKKFDYYYEQYMQDNFHKLYRSSYKTDVDTALNELRNLFSFADNDYFNTYIDYRYAIIKYLTHHRDQMIATKMFFLDKPVLYNNEAYMEMFNQVFQNFFSHYAATKNGSNIYSDIAKAKSPFRLKKTLGLNVSLDNDTLKELVILKGLHDAFYVKKSGSLISFPKKQLMQTLDSMIIITQIPQHRKIAENIKFKVLSNQLAPGDTAPNFELFNLDNEIVNSHNLKGKYLYISFYSAFNYECLLDIAKFENLHKDHSEDIDFVTIICDNSLDKFKKLVEQNKYAWTFLHYGNQPEILEKYFVKVFPAYILIDPYGKVLTSSGPSPDSFKKTFFNLLKSRN